PLGRRAAGGGRGAGVRASCRWGRRGRNPATCRRRRIRRHQDRRSRVKSETSTLDVTPRERFGYIDLTDDLRRAVKDSGVTEGMVVAFCPHTTCALIINEWEDGALEDFRRRLEVIAPDDVYYAHDDLERRTQNLAE